MKQFQLASLLFVLVFFWGATAQAYVGMHEGIEIKGTEAFVGRVKGALRLIEERAPRAWAIIRNYLKKVEEGDKTGMFPYLDPTLAVISSRAAACSLDWCAGAILNDAFRAKLYSEAKTKGEGGVPDDAWNGSEARKACAEFQLSVMKEIRSPYQEREFFRSCVNSSPEGECFEECPYG